METRLDNESYDSLVEDEIKFWSRELVKSISKGIPINLDYSNSHLFKGLGKSNDIYFHPEVYKEMYDKSFLLDKSTVRDGKALDLVCGPGWLARELNKRGMDVEGLELNPFIVDVANLYSSKRKNNNKFTLKYSVSDLNKAVFEKEKYDVICADSGLHHVSKIDRLFRQISKALKPGGRFVFREHIDRDFPTSILNIITLPLVFMAGYKNYLKVAKKARSLIKETIYMVFNRGETMEWGSAFEDVGASEIVSCAKKYFNVKIERYSFTIFTPVRLIADSNLELDKKIQWINFFMKIDRNLNQNGFHGECVEFLLTKR